MYGFLFRDGMPPADLSAAERAEARGGGVDLINDQVVGIKSGVALRFAGDRLITARRLPLATGGADESSDIHGAGSLGSCLKDDQRTHFVAAAGTLVSA